MNEIESIPYLDNLNSNQTKRNSIAKIEIALCFFLSIGFFLVFLYQDIFPLNNVFLFFTCMYALNYFIFIYKSKVAGKVLLYTLLLVHTYCLSMFLGDFGHIKLFYIPISIIPFLIFNKEEKIYLYIMVVLTVVNIIFINTTIHLFEIKQRFSLETYQNINNAFDVTSMLCLVFLVFTFLKFTESSELELLKANSELSIQKERESETNQTLKSAKEDQERLNVLKDYLFRIISHDLRSPINTIQSLTELIATGNLSKEEERIIFDSLRKSSESSALLLDNLLKWSVFQMNNSTEPTLKNVNIKGLILDIFNQLEIKSNQKQIQLLNHIHPDLVILADINMLEIILRNLISNAIKFSYEGHSIHVSAEINDSTLIIQVKDSGMGMPQDILDKLFTTDKSVCRNGTQEEKGTGIGLLLCKNLMESLNGNIDVISIPKQQTIFSVKLPHKKNLKDKTTIMC
jgi:signal transduction histidine kinase